jgi:hypothetical protein
LNLWPNGFNSFWKLIKLLFSRFSSISWHHPPTLPIAPEIFNYRRLLQDFSIDGLKAKPPDCFCHNTPFKYSPLVMSLRGSWTS